MSATLRFHDCLEWELDSETGQLHWICSRYWYRAVLNVSEKSVNRLVDLSKLHSRSG